jgi:hypothetical protein
MTISTVSSYQQLQNWSVSLTNVTRNNLGASNGGSGTDFSSDFGDVANSFYSNQATLAAQGALARVERDAYAASTKGPGGPPAETALRTARAAGNEVLASFGLADSFASKSSAAPNTAPANATTGYGHAQSTAAGLKSFATINVLA